MTKCLEKTLDEIDGPSVVGKPKGSKQLAKAALNMTKNTDAKIVTIQDLKNRTT